MCKVTNLFWLFDSVAEERRSGCSVRPVTCTHKAWVQRVLEQRSTASERPHESAQPEPSRGQQQSVRPTLCPPLRPHSEGARRLSPERGESAGPSEAARARQSSPDGPPQGQEEEPGLRQWDQGGTTTARTAQGSGRGAAPRQAWTRTGASRASQARAMPVSSEACVTSRVRQGGRADGPEQTGKKSVFRLSLEVQMKLFEFILKECRV